MAIYEDLTVKRIRLTSLTVDQINDLPIPKNGDVCFCNNESTSDRVLVTYDETAGAWIVVETGASIG